LLPMNVKPDQLVIS